MLEDLGPVLQGLAAVLTAGVGIVLAFRSVVPQGRGDGASVKDSEPVNIAAATVLVPRTALPPEQPPLSVCDAPST